MSPLEIVALVALTAYAIYRQTVTAEVKSAGRFKLAIIYAIAGVIVGGFNLPGGVWGYSLLVLSFALSAVVGLYRGRVTTMWVESDGRIMRRGTALTIGLFLGLVVSKFALGTVAYFTGIDDGEGFGEILVMIAIMIAVQAQIMWTRAQALQAMKEPQSSVSPS